MRVLILVHTLVRPQFSPHCSLTYSLAHTSSHIHTISRRCRAASDCQYTVYVCAVQYLYAHYCNRSQVINKGGVTYRGEPYHRECFVCSNDNCKKELAGLKFTSKEDKPYCSDCYGELFANRCCRCTKPIVGAFPSLPFRSVPSRSLSVLSRVHILVFPSRSARRDEPSRDESRPARQEEECFVLPSKLREFRRIRRASDFSLGVHFRNTGNRTVE